MNKWELLKNLDAIELEATLHDWSPTEIIDGIAHLVTQLDEPVEVGPTKQVLKLNDRAYLRTIHFGDEGIFNTITENPFDATSVDMIVGNIGSLGGKVVELTLSEK